MLMIQKQPQSTVSRVISGKQLAANNWRYGLIKIFDKHHIVALFVINQFIDELFRQQHAEAAWSQAPLFSNHHMAKQILG